MGAGSNTAKSPRVPPKGASPVYRWFYNSLASWSTARWQRTLLLVGILAVFIIPTLQAVCWGIWGWPPFPKHRTLSSDKYQERVTLLKYMISLSFSLIGATWYLASGSFGQQRLERLSRNLLAWSWTLLGIAALSAVAQIWLSYRDLWYWQMRMAEGAMPVLDVAKHFINLRILHATYKIADYSFFGGALLMVLAFAGVLHYEDEAGSRGKGTQE